jgi:hypothetical protein
MFVTMLTVWIRVQQTSVYVGLSDALPGLI